LAKSRGTTDGSATVVQDGDSLGAISFQGADGTEFVQGALIAAIVDSTPGANDMPTRLSFRTTADGAATPTERLRIANGGDVTVSTGNFVVGTAAKGIDFSANTGAAGETSSLLDWYEEGTWTPVPNPTSGSITSYTSSGSYSRIGATVTVIFNISITDAGTATALSNISGIPFTNGGVVASGAGREAGSTGAMWQYTLAASGTTIAGKKYDNDPGIATGYVLYGNLTYFV
jgi:hypothetical protein